MKSIAVKDNTYIDSNKRVTGGGGGGKISPAIS